LFTLVKTDIFFEKITEFVKFDVTISFNLVTFALQNCNFSFSIFFFKRKNLGGFLLEPCYLAQLNFDFFSSDKLCDSKKTTPFNFVPTSKLADANLEIHIFKRKKKKSFKAISAMNECLRINDEMKLCVSTS
jgi:hypothetical protein